MGAASGGAPSSGITLWVDGDWRDLSGGDAPVEWDGDVLGVRAGLDTRWRPDILAGLALSWSRGSFDWMDRGRDGYRLIDGTHESRMTSLHPYLAWWFSADTALWTSLGHGWGEVEIDDAEVGRRSSDIKLGMAAVGGHTRLYSDEALISGGTTVLTLKGAGWMSRFKVDGDGDRIGGSAVNAERLRLGLEGAHERHLANGSILTPSLELGVRHDGGDGETGAGVELIGRLAWTNPARGLTVEGRARTLLAHQGEIKERGVGVSVRLDTGADGRGLSLDLNPSWGATESGLARLWDYGSLAGPVAAVNSAARLQAEIGYGLGALGGRAVLTPYGGLAFAGGDARHYFLGVRLEMGPSLHLSLQGGRQESMAVGVDHAVVLRGVVSW